MVEKEVAVVVDEYKGNCKVVTIVFDSVDTLQDLQILIEQEFGLKKDSIFHLQIFSEKFQSYVNLNSLDAIQDGSKINAVLEKVSLIDCSLWMDG